MGHFGVIFRGPKNTQKRGEKRPDFRGQKRPIFRSKNDQKMTDFCLNFRFFSIFEKKITKKKIFWSKKWPQNAVGGQEQIFYGTFQRQGHFFFFSASKGLERAEKKILSTIICARANFVPELALQARGRPISQNWPQKATRGHFFKIGPGRPSRGKNAIGPRRPLEATFQKVASECIFVPKRFFSSTIIAAKASEKKKWPLMALRGHFFRGGGGSKNPPFRMHFKGTFHFFFLRFLENWPWKAVGPQKKNFFRAIFHARAKNGLFLASGGLLRPVKKKLRLLFALGPKTQKSGLPRP